MGRVRARRSTVATRRSRGYFSYAPVVVEADAVARRPRTRVAKRRVGRRPTRSARQESPVVPPPPRRLHNLPTQLTTFIGREQEIVEVKRLVGTTRLLTLTGSGGCGKTRLALQVAAEVLDEYADGVWLAELVSIADPALVPKTVASALDVPEQPGRDMIETLVDALRLKNLLLVLDNCEHLRTVCGDLGVAVLRACPEVRLLVTSQEGLRVPGETLWRVPSLSLPDARHLRLPEDLAEYEAVRLFVERAMAVAPGFIVTTENAHAVAQVCRRLDGIPLAIELAAARVKVLAVEQIASRLDDRFRLLSEGSRMVLPRQQTLLATMDWCYGLLSGSEQALLQRLSVFAGGWSFEAAEAVCAGGEVGASDILDLLTQLVDKSLVMTETHGAEARYRLLETVRQYGDEKLQSAGEAAEVRRRHRDWYLRLAERGEPALYGREQKAWIARLDIEHDNFRAALGWSNDEPGGAGAALRLAGLLSWFWWLRGHWREGRTWLERALTRSGDALPVDLPQAIVGAMAFANRLGDVRRAAELGQWGLAASRQVGDKSSEAEVLFWLGSTARREGDLNRAAVLYEESVAAARDAGDWWGIRRGLRGLGNTARGVGDVERAIALHTEVYAMSRESGDPWGLSIDLCYLGDDALQQNDYGRASGYFADALKLNRQGDYPWAIAEGLDGMAGVVCGENQHKRAGRLLGAASALREVLGDHRLPIAQGRFEQWIASTRKALGEAAFDEAWAEGRAMTMQQAVEYALESAEAEKPTGQQRRAGRPAGDPLTAREREVVGLVVRGLTNREIGARLVVSGRTADAHVQNILNKLGFSSRAQIAAWGVEHGLKELAQEETSTPRARPSQARQTT